MQAILKNYITTRQAAEMLGCGMGAIRKAIQRGRLEAIKINPRLSLVHRPSADEYRQKSAKSGRPRGGFQAN